MTVHGNRAALLLHGSGVCKTYALASCLCLNVNVQTPCAEATGFSRNASYILGYVSLN